MYMYMYMYIVVILYTRLYVPSNVIVIPVACRRSQLQALPLWPTTAAACRDCSLGPDVNAEWIPIALKSPIKWEECDPIYPKRPRT